MLERLAGNDALKRELGTALHSGRLPHAVLLVGEPGCGAGFAARCLAADYLYPAGGPHAEAVLKKEDTECLVLQGEGASGQIAVKRVREMREAIQRSALSTDAAGRVLFIYGAQNLNGSSANAMLKIIEEPPEGVLFVLTATSAATVLPTIRKALDAGAAVILLSHLGRPVEGEFDPAFSLRPVAEHLGKLLGRSVAFCAEPLAGVDVKPGDDAILLGQSETCEVTPDSLSADTEYGVNGWTTCQITARVPRIYVYNGQVVETRMLFC